MPRPEDRQSLWLAAVIVGLLVVGMTASLMAGDRLVEEAEQAWRERARREATRLTEVAEFGLEEAKASLRALSALFHSSDRVTDEEFVTAASVARGWRGRLRYEEFVFARHVPPARRAAVEAELGGPLTGLGGGPIENAGADEAFAVMQSTARAGKLPRRSDLAAHPVIRTAVATAYRSLNQVIVSSAFTQGGRHWAAVAFPVPNAGTDGVLVGLLDLDRLFEDLLAQAPKGLHLRLSQGRSRWREMAPPQPALEPILGPAEPPQATVETVRLQLANGQASWLLSWDLLPGYAGGPATLLGYAVAVGGCMMTMLVAALLTVLAWQNERIRDRVRERTHELARARDHAERANRTKTEFLANMSHELRTPLNAVIGFSEIIRDELVGPLGESRYREYARDIHDSAEHLLLLINDILDVAKAEAGKLELQEDSVDVARILEFCVCLMRERAEAGELQLDVAVLSRLPRLTADPRRLKQIVLNLLSNAMKFTEPGGAVAVSADLAADGSFEIVVSDTGIGMSEHELATALAPFSQVDSAFNRKFEGTGLGLPLTRHLLQMHGGRLELSSEKGAGTRAVARLPGKRVERRRDAA